MRKILQLINFYIIKLYYIKYKMSEPGEQKNIEKVWYLDGQPWTMGNFKAIDSSVVIININKQQKTSYMKMN